MILVDTVYQRVLALANKEQRGYITPQEFNLLANQAQMEIFEQYFYDLNQWNKQPENDTEFSGMLNLLEEKIRLFEEEQGGAGFLVAQGGGAMVIPSEVYRIGTVRIGGTQVEMLTSKQFDAVRFSYLTSPTPKRPIGYITSDGLWIAIGGANPTTGSTSGTFVNTNTNTNINLSYIKKPHKVIWGYTVINDKALYNSGSSVNFELHQSEETELVYKILSLAGIVIAKPGLGTYADQQITAQKTQEKQ